MKLPTKAWKPLFKGAVLMSAALCAMQAQAGLVYNWVTTSLSPTIWAAEGRIEVSASLWGGGTLEIPGSDAVQQGFSAGCHGSFYTNPNGGFYPGCTALVGIEDIYFNVNNRQVGAGVFYASLYMSGLLSVGAAGELTGNFYALSADATNVLMRSAPNSTEWTIELFSSDMVGVGGNGCYSQPYCTGATGRWVLDPASIPVPEPGSLALAGLALAGVAAARRQPKLPSAS